MSDNKTLADAQPGGRVRLGDALPPLPPMGYEVRGTGMGPHDVYYTPAAYTAEQMQDYARAALSAQPSPGGQGDALAALEEALKFIETLHSIVGGESRKVVWRCLERGRAALAARQPVGEHMRSDLSGYAVTASQVRRGYDVECDRCGKFCDEGPGPCQPVGEPEIWVSPGQLEEHKRRPAGQGSNYLPTRLACEGNFTQPLYAAPAQSVDLGPSQPVLAEIAQERARQEAKWGQQNHVDWTPTSAATDLAGAWPAGVGDHFKFITDYKAKGAEGHRLGYFDILMEEVAEAHDEARDGNTKATRAELVQVAAVAVAWIECIDRRLALTDSQAVGK